jgi:acetylglutamate kinase
MVTQDGLVRLGSRVFPADQGIPPHEYANGDFGRPVDVPEPSTPEPSALTDTGGLS